MAYFKPGEEQLERRASVGRWQIVRASFGTANEDLIIRHQLQTTNPEEVAYQALNMTGPATLYHDGSATRLAWGDGFVRLRVSVAPVVMDILLQVVAAPIGTTKLPMGGATIPGINADTLDGLDSTAFARNAFKTIVIDGAGDVVADEPEDTLTLSAGAGIEFNSVPGTDEIEILALAPVIDEIDDILDVNTGTPADGDVLTWDDTAGEWVAAAPTGGGGGGGGALVFLEEHIASSSATLDFTSWYSTDYDDYVIELVNVKNATNTTDLWMRISTDTGATWLTTTYYYSWIYTNNTGGSGVVSTGGGSAAQAVLMTSFENAAINPGGSGRVTIYNPGSTTTAKAGHIDLHAGQVGAAFRVEGFWQNNGTAAVNGIRFLFSSGNIASGVIRIYGIAKTAGGGGGGGASVLDDLTDVDVPAPADGDVLTWDSGTSEWIATAPTGGGGGGTAGWVLLEEHTASSSATLDFTTRNMTGTGASFQSDYDDYVFELINVIPATSGVDFFWRVSTDGGSTFVTTNSYSNNLQAFARTGAATAGESFGAPAPYFYMRGGADVSNSVTGGGVNGSVRLWNPLSTASYKRHQAHLTYYWAGSGGDIASSLSGGAYLSTTAVNAFRFYFQSGNIASGTIRLYGIAKTAGGGGGGGASELDDLTDVDAPTPADGDVLTWDAGTSEWVAAAPTGGSGGGTGALVYLGEQTASGSAALSFTSLITSTYDEYVVEILNMTPATSAASLCLQVSTNNGSSYDTAANYRWGAFNSSSAAAGVGTNQQNSGVAIVLWGDSGGIGSSNTATPGLAMTLKIYAPLDPANYTTFIGNGLGQYNSNGNRYGFQVAGWYNSITPVNAFKLLMSSGNIASGTARIYGIVKAGGTGGSGSPGTVVQVQNYQTGTMATGSTTIPHDNTIPQNTEGDEYMTLAITPTSATNKLKIDVVFIGTANGANWIVCSLFQDSNVNALATSMNYENIGTSARNNIFSHWMTAGTTSSTTFKVRAGVDSTSPGTVTFNGNAGGSKFGGTMASSITITEIDPAGTGASGILSDSVGQLDIANTTTETTLYTYSIPAGTLGTAKGLKLDLIGDWLNNTGSDQAIRLRIKYGATTLHDETAGTMPSAATRRPWTLNIQLGNTGTTNSQFATVSWLLGNAQAGTAGLGDAAVAMHLNHLGSGTSAEDSTLVKALTVTIELSAASANLSFRRQNASLKEL